MPAGIELEQRQPETGPPRVLSQDKKDRQLTAINSKAFLRPAFASNRSPQDGTECLQSVCGECPTRRVSDGLNFCQLLTQSLFEFLSFSVDWFALLGGQPQNPRDKMRHRSGIQ